MNVLAGIIRRLAPLFETRTEVVERDAVGVKAFTFGSVYHNVLRRQVHNLPELHFTSAQFLLCLSTLSDVDHGPHQFTQVPVCVQDRMTGGPDVPDSPDGVNEAHFEFEIHFVADRSVELFPDRGLRLNWLDPLKKCFGKWEWLHGIETQQAIALL